MPRPTTLSRRELLRLGACGALGLSSPRLLRADARAGEERAIRSCVVLLLHGGPSQLDVWDLKPAAPAEIRGEFSPIGTAAAGVQIVEHLPRIARIADRLTIVRSMTHASFFHNTATTLVTTGSTPLSDVLAFTPSENDFPHLGAQLALKDAEQRDVPTAVSLPDPVTDGPYTTPGQNGGFLGARYAPFAVYGDPNAPDFTVDGLATDERLAGARRDDRHALLAAIDAQRPALGQATVAADWHDHQQRAISLLESDATRRAFALSSEPPRIRERYGRHKYGQSLLLARRLVEAGVRLVTVYWGGKVNNPVPFWDTHFNNNRRLRDELLPPFDRCFSAFVEDLEQRGLLESTLVVCMGEFGRTPRFGQNTGNGVDDTGRDHWPQCYSLVLAGGPAPGGRVLGRSDRFAAYPAEDPYTPADLTATILHALGVDPSEEVVDAFGRRVPLSAGTVRRELVEG